MPDSYGSIRTLYNTVDTVDGSPGHIPPVLECHRPVLIGWSLLLDPLVTCFTSRTTLEKLPWTPYRQATETGRMRTLRTDSAPSLELLDSARGSREVPADKVRATRRRFLSFHSHVYHTITAAVGLILHCTSIYFNSPNNSHPLLSLLASMDGQTTKPDTAQHTLTTDANKPAEQPWYAAYPQAHSEGEAISRHNVLHLLKTESTAESTFVLVDLRRTDHEERRSYNMRRVNVTDSSRRVELSSGPSTCLPRLCIRPSHHSTRSLTRPGCDRSSGTAVSGPMRTCELG